MKKSAVIVIAQRNFRDEELLIPQKILMENGIDVKVAALTRFKAIGKLGTEIEPDLAIAEIEPVNFDALIFAGGPGARDYFEAENIFSLVRSFGQPNKVLAAICIAPTILANAGVLIGKTVTGFSTEEEILKNKGADYTGMNVEVDGHIVTAKEAQSAAEFAEKIVELLRD